MGIGTIAVALVGTISALGICYALNSIKLDKWPGIGKYKCYIASLGNVALLTFLLALMGI